MNNEQTPEKAKANVDTGIMMQDGPLSVLCYPSNYDPNITYHIELQVDETRVVRIFGEGRKGCAANILEFEKTLPDHWKSWTNWADLARCMREAEDNSNG